MFTKIVSLLYMIAAILIIIGRAMNGGEAPARTKRKLDDIAKLLSNI